MLNHFSRLGNRLGKHSTKDPDLKDSAHFLNTVLKKMTLLELKKVSKNYGKKGKMVLTNKDIMSLVWIKSDSRDTCSLDEY